MTIEEALEAVKRAPWVDYNSSLIGTTIWGKHGEFAKPRATISYTYLLALDECMKIDESKSQLCEIGPFTDQAIR